MDFFNSKPTTSSSTTTPSDALATPFMQALNGRFASGAPPSLLTSAFTPAMPLQTPMLPSAASPSARFRPPVPRLGAVPQGAVAGPPTPSLAALKQQGGGSVSAPIAAIAAALLPEQVVSLTNLRDVLVIDIRPHAQFQTSRLPGAVSLVVPSTLLKRPNFSLEKMAVMIGDDSGRSRFEKWRSMKKLVVYDVDTSVLSDTTNLAGLMRKFQAAGYQGELLWVKGGFNALLRISPLVIDTAVLIETLQEDPVEERQDTFLRARNLSTHAFQQSSTTLVGQRTPKGSDHTRTASSASVAANPFYDNIRQNIELSQGVDARIPLALPREVIARKYELPFKWLQDIVEQSVKDEAGDQLAMQFYRIELGEQRRLQGVMEHHSTESRHRSHSESSGEGDDYPYSITAGIEMGSKNRYRNIWPFEHARVRLPKSSKGGSDYFNASFVQSLVSDRRYIATQGPLDSTYDDFWAICWAQEVPVVVMLTREVESSLIKCGKYWKDGQYGDITLRLLSQIGVDDDRSRVPTPGFFHAPAVKEAAPDSIIERVFQLTNKAQPHVPPRKVIHLQYLGWPDMDVPESPGGLLTLIRRVNIATNEHIHASMKVKQGPVLLHCSAGVGRTGGFLLVDSILAGIRHEMQRNGSLLLGQGQSQSNSGSEEMDVDEPESVISSGKPLRSSPDDISPRSRSSAPQSTSGSELAHTSNPESPSLSSSFEPFSEWTRRPIRGSSIATESSPVTAPKPRTISDLVAANLKKASHSNGGASSSKAQVAAWSKKLKMSPASLRATPPDSVGPMSSSEELKTKGGINYKLPRKLDDLRGSPPMPSAFPEPVREVLEDMREQRMSLCQSLRQYVFAHRAIIAGALELVDEAAEVKRQEAQAQASANAGMKITNGALFSAATISNETAWSSTSSICSTSGAGGPPSSSPTRALAGRFSSPRDCRDSASSSVASSPPPPPPKVSTGKRSASPSVMYPTGSAGRSARDSDTTLLKRPSLKRKHKTGGSQADDTPRSQTRQHIIPGSNSSSRDR